MANKELWLQNNTGSDVSLSDLGVKVPANRTINAYKYNPYLTAEQVQKSQEDGSLAKRLKANTLSVVAGAKDPTPHTLHHIKSNRDVVEVVKSKSSIFIDTKNEDVLEDEDLGDFADYGLGELGHQNTFNAKVANGAVVVNQKQDEVPEESSDAEVKLLEVQSNVSGQSVVAMAQQAEAQTNSVGPIAETKSEPGQPYVVVAPPVDSTENSIPQVQPDVIRQAEAKLKAVDKVKKSGDMVVIDGTLPDNKKTDNVIKEEGKSFDAQVATKDESGAIVMKLKEVDASEESVTKKVKKATAKKKTSKKTSKKKTS